jgi:peptide-methionine (S)-S-oxide reductase
MLLAEGQAQPQARIAQSEAKKQRGRPMGKEKHSAEALVGGGCFWCVEAAYETLPGVIEAENGYSGGAAESPSYEEVCTGKTGHAEVVRIVYDRDRLSYRQLLDFFFTIHDPTTEDRQGADIGEQYRSVIFYSGEEEREEAEDAKAAAQARFDAPILTSILPRQRFWPAEDYHQDYFRRHPDAAYCRIVIAPKIARLTSPSQARPGPRAV